MLQPVAITCVGTGALPKLGLCAEQEWIATDRTDTVKHCILCVCAVLCGAVMMCHSPMKRA
jgi:hypothetical protein